MSCSLVFGEDTRVLAYLEARLDTKLSPPFTTIGIERDGEIVGGWLFNDYNASNIEISVALDCAVSLSMIKSVKAYLHKAGVKRVTGRCRESNHKSHLMLKRLGFVWEGRSPLYYGNEACIIYGYIL